MDNKAVSKRNFKFLTLEGILFLSGCTFIDANSVIPIFIDIYTGSLQLAGLASTLKMTLFFLPQFFLGPYLLRIRNMPRFTYIFMVAFRPVPLLMIPILFSGMDRHVTAYIFIVLYSILWIEEGITWVPWTEVFSRTITQEKRGKLFGMQQFFAGAGSILG